MDFAVILSPSLTFDWAIVGGDLAVDDGLDTAVAISLWSDRVAAADDVIPDGTSDRRGWWGDAYLDLQADGTPDNLGSRLWLLSRALQIPQTALAAQSYCQQALQWLVDDGVAAQVTTPLPTFPARGQMEIVNIIAQITPGGAVNRRFASLWNMTANTVSMSGLVLGGI